MIHFVVIKDISFAPLYETWDDKRRARSPGVTFRVKKKEPSLFTCHLILSGINTTRISHRFGFSQGMSDKMP